MVSNRLEFTEHARSLGVNSIVYAIAADYFGESLDAAAKRVARFLKKQFPEFNHSQLLEAVAQSIGFPNWHAFSTLTTKLVRDYSLRATGVRKAPEASILESLRTAITLLIEVREAVPPTDEQIKGLRLLAVGLSVNLGKTENQVLDVLAKMQGSDTFDKFVIRRPEESTNPLYWFEALPDEGAGRFIVSDAGMALVDELDALWQHYESRPRADQKLALAFITRLLSDRDDFLEGWLALATIQELEGEYGKAGVTYNLAIKKANSLIPVGFKGTVPWGFLSNRFYHRLLYGYMRWCGSFDLFPEAIKLARRQLRLNPTDNLGLRLLLPVFLAADGQHSVALKSLTKLRRDEKTDDSHAYLVSSLCLLAAEQRSEGLVKFFRALFHLPVLRPLLISGKLPDDWRRDGRRWHRGFIPDMDTVWYSYLILTHTYPHVRRLYLKVLASSSVKRAEATINKLYADLEQAKAEDNKHGRLVDHWHFYEEAAEEIKQLSDTLVSAHLVNWVLD